MDTRTYRETAVIVDPAVEASQTLSPRTNPIRERRQLGPIRPGPLDYVALALAIAMTLGPLTAYGLGYGA